MKIKITTITENTVPTGFGQLGEHGLSFLIEYGDRNILLDTGQGLALANNAIRMGADLKKTDTVVLSHGHYDHTGGLKTLMNLGAKYELIAHPDVFSEKLAMHPKLGFIPIGAPLKRDALEESGVRIRLGTEPVEVAKGVTATGEIPMKTEYEKIEPMLFVREGGKEIPDPIADDQALIIDADEGLVVLFGCAHRGIINTLTKIQEITGKEKIHTVIGGLHLERAPEAQIAKTIAALGKYEPRSIQPAHCSGARAVTQLMSAFGGRVTPCNVGNTLIFNIS